MSDGSAPALGEGQRWVDLRPPGAQTSVALVTWFETMPPGSLKGLGLATDDLAGDYERLRARGVRFHDGIEHAPWGSFATFDDPDGNGWVLPGAGSREPGAGSREPGATDLWVTRRGRGS